ncbi:hypothetical protein GCM10027072_23390 [Streptomyces bullii]
MTTMNTPITAQPATFTHKVVQGNPPAAVGHHTEAAYRAAAPAPPPSATTATTGAWARQAGGRAVVAGGRREGTGSRPLSASGVVMAQVSYSPGPGHAGTLDRK